METNFAGGPVLHTPAPAAARAWLCENLLFSPAPGGAVQNGGCALLFRGGAGAPLPPPAPGSYYTGLAHVALHTGNIAAALAHCQARGLCLQLRDGSWFHNPKVFGAGEYYFNVQTPFGLTVEISQPVAQPGGAQDAPFAGLDHLGVPCGDFDAELAFLQARGFVPLFAPVENANEAEGRIRCVMMGRGPLVLEVYQFLDLVPAPMPGSAVLRGVLDAADAVSPGGLRFLQKEV